jgi:hypothetical protein
MARSKRWPAISSDPAFYDRLGSVLAIGGSAR